jgi:arylsulfatase
MKYNVLPIDDRVLDRFNAGTAGRPDLMAGRTSLTVYQGMKGMSEHVFINTKNRSHTITADVDIPQGGANGVILAQAGRFGGWSLYIKDGKPTYTYNFLGLQRFTVASSQPLTAGKATIRYEFVSDGPGMGKGGIGTILVNGQKVAEGRIERTQCCAYSADEGADVGTDDGTPVTEDYKEGDNRFTGTIHKVTIDLKNRKTADRQEEEKARLEVAHKKALAD